jgi:hypothetical protein
LEKRGKNERFRTDGGGLNSGEFSYDGRNLNRSEQREQRIKSGLCYLRLLLLSRLFFLAQRSKKMGFFGKRRTKWAVLSHDGSGNSGEFSYRQPLTPDPSPTKGERGEQRNGALSWLQ